MSTKMNSTVKKLWTTALRSGEFKQTQEVLCDGIGHCCLGVLCALHAKAMKKKGFSPRFEEYGHAYLGENEKLPEAVQKWAGLDGGDPDIGRHEASILNDDYKKSFNQIADLIDKHL